MERYHLTDAQKDQHRQLCQKLQAAKDAYLEALEHYNTLADQANAMVKEIDANVTAYENYEADALDQNDWDRVWDAAARTWYEAEVLEISPYNLRDFIGLKQFTNAQHF